MTNSLDTLKLENNRLRGDKEKLLEINSMYLSNFEVNRLYHIQKIYVSRTDRISPRPTESQLKISEV